MNQNVIIEISGYCNANCPWCFTHLRNHGGKNFPTRFMPVKEFAAVLDRLDAMGATSPKTVVEIFNWGEPLLHPDLPGIVGALAERNTAFRISTNASRPVRLKGSDASKLENLVFSMPGFSQTSYDRGHGFSFKSVLANMAALEKEFRDHGFAGQATVSFHVYQHNFHELGAAAVFCRDHNLRLSPYYATPMDYATATAYLRGDLPRKVLELMSKSLFLHYVDHLLRSPRPGGDCWHKAKIVIDEFGQALTCCVVPKGHPDYAVGSIFDLDMKELMRAKATRKVCLECMALGLDRWFLNPARPGPLAKP